MPIVANASSQVAPARERGLKFAKAGIETLDRGRSRKGAWIEISVRAEFGNDPRVAPARERGLKWCFWTEQRYRPSSLPQGSVD